MAAIDLTAIVLGVIGMVSGWATYWWTGTSTSRR